MFSYGIFIEYFYFMKQGHLNIIGLILLTQSFIVQSQPINWRPVQQIVQKYIGMGTFPGGVLKIANSTSILYSNTFGHLSHQKIPYGAPPFTEDVIFDMASLTKVTATLSAIMHLYQKKQLDIFDKVSRFIPEYANNGKENTTIQNLLLHNSGLRPVYPYVSKNSTKKQTMQWIYACKLDNPVGTVYQYSSLGYVLLGQIAQRIQKKPLEQLTRQYMDEMGMFSSTFLPSKQLIYKIAPTTYSEVRKTLIRGDPHDSMAYLLGGVAGHAGFFSTAQDLTNYMQILLRNGTRVDGKRIYSQQVVHKFLTRVDGLPYENRRALGFDTVPIQQYPPCGSLFSLNSFGHTGYTGMMIYADRDKDLIIVLLTNRVHPYDNLRLNFNGRARAQISDQIVRTLGLA